MFDRRRHLYIGYNDVSAGGQYQVLEVNLPNFAVVRTIRVPQWSNSSVAIDDQNELYVNTKSFVGGDVKIFRDNSETKPYLEIKNAASPLTIYIGGNALWVGFKGPFEYGLARYRLRSTDQTWFKTLRDAEPLAIVSNADGSLLATLVRRNSTRAVDVIDVKTGNRARTLVESKNLTALTTDGLGHVYVAERNPGGRGTIHACNFRGCTFSFETSSTTPRALAVSRLDETLYVANIGKPNVQVFNPATGSVVMTIYGPDPKGLAIEP